MNLTVDEGMRFYVLYAMLLSFVNRKLEVSPVQFSNFREYVAVAPEARVAIRDALFAHRELIDEFKEVNAMNLKADDLEIVVSWKNAVAGKFYVFRYLKNCTVFLTTGGSPNKAYGILGLSDPMEQVIGPNLPKLVTTVLLPFRDKIIYDGLVSGYNMTFGGGIKRSLNEEYKQAKETYGIITSLENEKASAAKLPKKPKQRSEKTQGGVGSRSTSEEAKAVGERLIQMTDSFCSDFLDEEYAELCRKLATALARKRPSPLLQGRLEGWAAGVVRTIGWVNFLNDSSQSPHLKMRDIDKVFGIAESTGAAKLKTIRDQFKIVQLDPKWTLPRMMDENPLVWLLKVNGFLIDIRSASREHQEVAFQKGLIPYIPADRDQSEAN